MIYAVPNKTLPTFALLDPSMVIDGTIILYIIIMLVIQIH